MDKLASFFKKLGKRNPGAKYLRNDDGTPFKFAIFVVPKNNPDGQWHRYYPEGPTNDDFYTYLIAKALSHRRNSPFTRVAVFKYMPYDDRYNMLRFQLL
jgi:hypothetical protein